MNFSILFFFIFSFLASFVAFSSIGVQSNRRLVNFYALINFDGKLFKKSGLSLHQVADITY